jgi:sugar lactone lactonase YvrE
MSLSKIASLLLLACASCAHTGSPAATTSTSDTFESEPIALPVEPNGLWWSASEQALYFAGGDAHTLYRRDRDGAIKVVGTFPALPGDDKGGLGQLVITREGTIVATRFGGGTSGGVVFVRRDGSSGSVPNLDPTRRRIGLALADDGTLYDSYFHADDAMKTFRGAVARLTLEGNEVDVLPDLQKPVGVIVVGKRLIVSDQVGNRILQGTLPVLSDAATLADNVPSPDLMTVAADGQFFAASRSGVVFRVDGTGHVSTITSGLRAIRGIAYDASGRRLFFVERGDRKQSLPPILRILQLPN